MPTADSRYDCHVFVCVNQRPDGRKSCGHGDNLEVRKQLKEEIKASGLNDRVRISGSLCLGACGEGPNVVIYPQELWFHQTTLKDVPAILETIKGLL
ncbi:MAG: (2Fe-2S) ferredoxin domain-containing protein [Planctomycetota bacterium]|jgi:(2Fe-2S) ferredoxin